MTEPVSPGVQRYVSEARRLAEARRALRDEVRRLRFDTIAVHGVYGVEEALRGGQGGIVEPVLPSTSQVYRDSDEMEAALAYLIPTWCYSRIHNPTVFYLEETLALLESYQCGTDASALVTASGMAAIKQAVEPLLAQRERGEPANFASASQVYGGTFQLFGVRMRERGAEVRWVTRPWDTGAWREVVDEHTRFLYAEMPSNPQQACLDVEAVAAVAHEHGIPLIVDATIATPALLRPLAHGADIVVHSLTKTVGAGGFAIAGAVVARHGLTSRHLGEEERADYASWLKLWPFRDSGPCLSPFAAFMLLNELRTLRWKVERLSVSTARVAAFLAAHPAVERVDYLGLPEHPLYGLASRYLRLVDSGEPAFGHLLSFVTRGDPGGTRRFFDGLRRIVRATDLGRIKSVATIPAISTHQQQGEEGRELAGIPPTMVRLCVGAEHPDDVIADLDQALARI